MKKRVLWTDEKIQLLKENYGLVSKEELQLLFPEHKYENIVKKASAEGIAGVFREKWTPEEDARLKKFYPYMTNEMLLKEFKGRNVSMIKNRAARLNLKKNEEFKKNYKIEKKINRDDIWTDEEDEILRSFYPTESISEIIRRLPNRTYSAIKNRVSKMGIKKNRYEEQWVRTHSEVIDGFERRKVKIILKRV